MAMATLEILLLSVCLRTSVARSTSFRSRVRFLGRIKASDNGVTEEFDVILTLKLLDFFLICSNTVCSVMILHSSSSVSKAGEPSEFKIKVSTSGMEEKENRQTMQRETS